MKKLSERILKDETVMALLKDVTDAEREEFMVWLEQTMEPFETVSMGMKDLVSTEKSTERLCDAINGIAKEAGLLDV